MTLTFQFCLLNFAFFKMIQVYTGTGKGKTTAALGLALRAVGAGKKVCIIQFLKPAKPETSEAKAIKKYLSQIKLQSFGQPVFLTREQQTKKDIDLAKEAWQAAKKALAGRCEVIILDEINVALYFGLLAVKEVVAEIKSFSDKKEIILTGRNAPKEIIKIADLVTQMKEIKHYFKQGVAARKGIEF